MLSLTNVKDYVVNFRKLLAYFLVTDWLHCVHRVHYSLLVCSDFRFQFRFPFDFHVNYYYQFVFKVYYYQFLS